MFGLFGRSREAAPAPETGAGLGSLVEQYRLHFGDVRGKMTPAQENTQEKLLLDILAQFSGPSGADRAFEGGRLIETIVSLGFSPVLAQEISRKIYDMNNLSRRSN